MASVEESLYQVPEGLTQDDVDEAKELVDEIQPLKDIKFTNVFPILKLAKCGKSSKVPDEKKPLLGGLGKSIKKSRKFKKSKDKS
jgi:hypothetical protein